MKKILLAFILSCWFNNSFSQNDTTLINLGKAAEKNGDYVQAVKYYSDAIEKCQPFTGELQSSYIYRAGAKFTLNDFRGAFKDAKLALEVKVKSSKTYWIKHKDFFDNQTAALAYYIMGICSIKLGNKEEGCNYLSLAGEKGDKSAYEAITTYCN